MQLWPQSKGGFFLKLYLGKYFGIIVSYKTVLLNSNHQNHTITQQPQTDVSHNTDILYMRSPSVVDSCINSDKEHWAQLSLWVFIISESHESKAKVDQLKLIQLLSVTHRRGCRGSSVEYHFVPTFFVRGLFSSEDDEREKDSKVLCRNFKSIPDCSHVPTSKHFHSN